MSRYLIVDIETVGLQQSKDWLDDEPVTAPANYKDAEKIAAYIAKAEAERFEKLALDPDCNRIVALGFIDAFGQQPTVYVMKTEFEEREHLKMFWDIYAQQYTTRLVTFNGFRFDLPVLMRRSMYLDVKAPILNLDRYRSEHIDLWQRLSFNGSINAHSLKFYAKRLGIGTLDKVSGADIGQLVAEDTKESWNAVEQHVISDVGLTQALAVRLGLIPHWSETKAGAA